MLCILFDYVAAILEICKLILPHGRSSLVPPHSAFTMSNGSYMPTFTILIRSAGFATFLALNKPTIWGITKSEEIERIHLKFLKSILCVQLSTSNMAVYGELGRFPLYISRYVCVINYCIKLMKSDNVLIKELCLDMTADVNRSLKNWESQVKVLPDMYVFSHIWLTQHITNLENFHNYCI